MFYLDFPQIEGFLSTPELDFLQRELERYIQDVVPTLPSRYANTHTPSQAHNYLNP